MYGHLNNFNSSSPLAKFIFPFVCVVFSFSSQSIGYLFILFAVGELLSLSRSHMFIFPFISIALGNWPKNTSVWFMLETVLLMFSSRNFMVSCLIFQTLSRFEFNFLYGVKMRYKFIDLHVAVQLSQHHCWRDCLFSIVCPCPLCWWLIDHRCVGLFLGCLFCSIDPYVGLFS